MTVSVISMQGLNTRQAVIHTQHTREDAIAFCREYEQNLTDECVNRELATPMNDYVAANCSTGVFVDFIGNRYRFEGLQRGANSDFAKYRIRDLSSGEVEDGSSASGYSTNLGIFHALCFMRAPDASCVRRRRVHERRSAGHEAIARSARRLTLLSCHLPSRPGGRKPLPASAGGRDAQLAYQLSTDRLCVLRPKRLGRSPNGPKAAACHCLK
jgi:hypothetical protein